MFSYDSLLRHRSALRSLQDEEPQLDLSTLFGNVSAKEIIANVTYYTELLRTERHRLTTSSFQQLMMSVVAASHRQMMGMSCPLLMTTTPRAQRSTSKARRNTQPSLSCGWRWRWLWSVWVATLSASVSSPAARWQTWAPTSIFYGWPFRTQFIC